MRAAIREAEAAARRVMKETLKNAPDYGLGFKRAIMPEHVFNTVIDVIANGTWKHEKQGIGIHNYFGTSPVSDLIVETDELIPWALEEMRPMHEEWCGFELEPIVGHGPRRYTHGAYLEKHVDKVNRIIGSTICIGHSLELPWPLYIEDSEGNPHYIDMNPGDMIFYESSRLVHGRPYPMVGKVFVGFYLQYAPKGEGVKDENMTWQDMSIDPVTERDEI